MITINLDKAKNIAHNMRRAKRAEEFSPLDVKATIPSEATAAEATRQVVREKYAQVQVAIDASTTPNEIKSVLENM